MKWSARLILAALVCAAGPALSQTDTCAPLPDDRAERDRLHADLAAAPDAMAAQPLNAALWALWTAAPDGHAQELLDSGVARLRIADYGAAEAAFTALIAYCPDYAEGFNQRAFAHYLRGDFAAALVDLDAALARAPRHVGAQSGKGLTLIGLGREREALEALVAAVALHPWLSERALIPGLRESLGDRDL